MSRAKLLLSDSESADDSGQSDDLRVNFETTLQMAKDDNKKRKTVAKRPRKPRADPMKEKTKIRRKNETTEKNEEIEIGDLAVSRKKVEELRQWIKDKIKQKSKKSFLVLSVWDNNFLRNIFQFPLKLFWPSIVV